MNWNQLTGDGQLEIIIEESKSQPVIIFKHSTRCNISSMVKNRLDREEAPQHVKFYFLDLIAYRSISNKIAKLFQVHHQSPQILLIKNGECTYEESHNGITMDEIVEQAAA